MKQKGSQTTIKISHRLRDFLVKKSVRKTQSYEDVIWALIGAKAITQEDKDAMPPEYVDNLNKKAKVRQR